MTTVETQNTPAITMTDTAVKHIKKYVAKHDQGKAMRLGVNKSGCSGLKYEIGIATDIAADDKVYDNNGACVIVAKDDLIYVVGTELDYIQEGLNWKLVFNNPNAQNSCGCGESFNLNS
tara:strand:+ start:12315 stop:12671 length:357 start_codon:yes stop_codon:yes gene_type:complete